MQQDDTSFSELFLAHPVPMWVYDLETLAFLAVNTAAIKHYGYTHAEFLGMTIRDIRPPEHLARLEQTLQRAARETRDEPEIWQHYKKDGTRIDVEITSHPLRFKERPCRFVLAHDVTGRRQNQCRIARLNRIYAVLSSINSTIIRTHERAALFGETCRIATMEGEFIAAWIGVIDPDSLDGTIVAQAGCHARLIDHARLTARAGTPESAWPACRAVRERVPVICNDMSGAPHRGPLADGVAEPRHRAMAAFPLIVDQRAAGVLVLFADVVDYFGEAEMRLLTELAADVSFALQYIEREQEHKRVTDRLEESEAGLRRAQVANKSAHVISGQAGSFISWSETLPLLIGVPPADLPPTHEAWLQIVHPDDRGRFRDACVEAARRGDRVDVEYRVRRGDGAIVQFRQVMEPLARVCGDDGGTRWFNTIQDVTEQREQQERIARLSRIYAVSSGISGAIMRIHERDALMQEACRVAVHEGAFSMAWIGMLDPATGDGKVIAWFGGEPGYAEKIRFSTRADSPDRERPACVAVREMRSVICNDIAGELTLSPLRDELVARGHRALAALPLVRNDAAVGVIVLFANTVGFFDAEEMKLLGEVAGDLSFALQFIDNEEQLSYLAYYDALTGLPNSKLFQDRLAQFLHTNKAAQEFISVILINLNRFAQLNDAIGHHAGDALLQQVAKCLNASLQGPHILARVSGDTFAIAIADLRHAADAAGMLEQQVFAPLSQVFTVDQREVRISVRAGLSLYPGDGQDAETLFKRAEVALKNAKASGERSLYYAPEMNAALAARQLLENELQHALATQQFVVHYQPRIDLLSGRIVAAEALLRWQHPQRGMIFPDMFIALAEEIGLINAIGAWVIDTVCAQQASWLGQDVALVPVAINLSAVQFKNGAVLKTICDAVTLHGLTGRDIAFELTESMVMDYPQEATEALKALKALGIRLALDDFGTGYSSLGSLQRFPVDSVKIDRAFIAEVTGSAADAAIATAMIAMAHSLNLRVVAEGVETEGQLHFLLKRRCDEIQGAYFSAAVAADAFEAMLRDDKQLPLPDLVHSQDTLLIVDDEPNNLSALNRLLRREGYRVLTAASGEEGLDLLAINAVQVIISDQRMPGMSGSQFLGIVKEMYPDTIRIILSGYTDLNVVTDSVNRGAVFKFLTKPWDDALLREHIRDAFRRYRPAA